MCAGRQIVVNAEENGKSNAEHQRVVGVAMKLSHEPMNMNCCSQAIEVVVSPEVICLLL